MFVCELTGAGTVAGRSRSKSMRASKRFFRPNLHYHRFDCEGLKVRLRLSQRAVRIVKKSSGIESFLLSNRSRYND